MALVVTGGALATANSLEPTRTGRVASGWQSITSGPGQWLNLGGHDRLEVLEELTADIPVPAGYEQQGQDVFTTGSLADTTVTRSQEHVHVSESAARAAYADFAICAWADAWVAGDAAARDKASTVLTQSLQWDAVRTLDPDPSPTGYLNDQGVATATRFGWVPAIAQAAASSQRQSLLDAVTESTRCWPEYTPAMNADAAYQGNGA
ncbi:hypothetical protein [Kineococcus sp. SYSU DK018]|uniref:hypothetical protein n=1 Tax=Kineococcus sp. SYSU DK018 TaxID=3383139 RepID=UPI003D7D041D